MIPLICPRCRRADALGLHVATIEGGRCLGCGGEFVIVDGVPCVFREARVPEGPEPLTAMYARSSEGPLQSWLRAHIPPGALELGSGIGHRADTVLLDENLTMLRAAKNPVRVCADVLDPPFLPESFGAVVLANVLDSVSDPCLAFQQAFALTEPGGLIIVSCAYAFASQITPPELQFDEDVLSGAFGGVAAGAMVERERLVLDWPLRVSDRLTHVHRADVFVWERR